MKKFKMMLLAMLFMGPLFMSAQSLVGDWMMEGENEAGEKVYSKISFTTDGSMKIDFGNDGKVDIFSTYETEGNRVMLKDTSTESPCYGKVGIYEVAFEGDMVSVKLVEDPCDQRRGNGDPGSMKRIK